MRILFLTIGYPPGGLHGSAIYTRNMARALAARGHEVHVLNCVDPWHESSEEHDTGVAIHHRRPLRVPGIERLQRWLPHRASATIHSLRWKWHVARFDGERAARRVINSYQYYHAYRQLRMQFDVIESPGQSLEFLFGVFRPTPLVVHLHTPAGFDLMLEGKPLSWNAKLADGLDRRSVRRANVLTSGSRMMVNTLRKSGWLDSSEPRIVPLTIDPSALSSVPSVQGTKPVVLTVGRLEFRKAPEVLVEAAALLAKDVLELDVLFVGSMGRPNEYRDRLVGLAERMNAPCRFEGQVTDEELLFRYTLARVVAVPSRSESFSLAGLEAMAAGRPIVCTSAVGLAEYVEGTGAGTVVVPDDPSALAEGIRPYLESPELAAKAGERAREVVRSQLSSSRIASEREAAYEEAILRWRRRRRDLRG